MDTYAMSHLIEWSKTALLDDERQAVTDRIFEFCLEYPDVVENHSWPEIRYLAERDNA